MANVLLIDDDKIARTLYTDFLVGAGHVVKAVAEADEAFAELDKTRYDLVVTDLILPKSDGLEVLEHVKAHHPLTEVLVITALDKVDPAVRAIKSGAADYLVKPVNPEVLAHAVSRAMTARALMTENAQLRQTMSLLETGQRIATTLERERLSHTAALAFEQACGAQATALLMREGDAYSLQGTSGLSEEEATAAKEPLCAAVAGALRDLPPSGGEIEFLGQPDRFQTVWAVPAVDAERTYGAVVLFFAQEVAGGALERAAFLARHLGLAQRNLGKFAEVEDLVYLDDLTHLFNNRYLVLMLDKDVKAATGPAPKPFTLLFMDLDYFKSVNDTHGHVVGSKLLVEVARVLKGCVRDNDIVTRWGGDEYVLLLRGTDSGGALKVAERIRRSIENHHFLAREGYGLSITTSIGICSYPEHAQTRDDLIDLADRAMYRGKKGSRNIIYMAAKNLDPTPVARRNTQPPAAAAAKAEKR